MKTNQSMSACDELLYTLEDLCKGIVTREQVSEWAISIINNESIKVSDPIVWEVLEGLGAADLPSTDREYLYTIEDFEAWKSELLNK